MAKEAMPDHTFEQLLSKITQETDSTDRKLDILFDFRGFFSAQQAARVLYAFKTPSDKIKAIQIMEPKLTRMTCSEARDVIGAVSIHNDKVTVLQSLKRFLTDYQTRDGSENIYSAYCYEPDKYRAAAVLNTVRSDVFDRIGAGGHQGYAALGSLHGQSFPLVPNLYGPVEDQKSHVPGQGDVHIPVTARPAVLPSVYSGHPSYAFPQGRDYAEDRDYPANPTYADIFCDDQDARAYPVPALKTREERANYAGV